MTVSVSLAEPASAEPARSANLLLDYYDRLPTVIRSIVDNPAPVTEPGAFSPGYALPELTAEVRGFLAAATARWQPFGEYQGHRLALLDLTGNAGTHTTKTYPSLLIVARAVEFIRRTGQPVMIFTPTSANKGTALRDAVLRALDAGLVAPEQLRVAVLAPRTCAAKLRQTRLATDPELRALNPVLLYTGEADEDVKALGREFVHQYAERARAHTGVHLWYTLELANYLVADTARAFFEQTVDPPTGERPRVHTHAVSSAYGLLGYHLGREVLEQTGEAVAASRPASLLIQQLNAPDMVLSLLRGSFDRAGQPRYRYDSGTGLHRQDEDPHFPLVAVDPAEVLDPTFYTHQPPTAARMNAIINQYGGTGIVVSLHECMARYPVLRHWFGSLPRGLPADPRTLREWSMPMAMTGTLNALDRGLLPAGSDLVIHASGWYAAGEYQPLDTCATVPVGTVDEVAAAVLAEH